MAENDSKPDKDEESQWNRRTLEILDIMRRNRYQGTTKSEDTQHHTEAPASKRKRHGR